MASKPNKNKSNEEDTAMQAVEDALRDNLKDLDLEALDLEGLEDEISSDDDDASQLIASLDGDVDDNADKNGTDKEQADLSFEADIDTEITFDETEINLDELEQKLALVANDLRVDDETAENAEPHNDLAVENEVSIDFDDLEIKSIGDLEPAMAGMGLDSEKLSDITTARDSTPNSTLQDRPLAGSAQVPSPSPSPSVRKGMNAEDRRTSPAADPDSNFGNDDLISAANDDQADTISDLVYSMQQQPRSSAGLISLVLGLIWTSICGYYAYTQFGAEFAGDTSFSGLIGQPKFIMLSAAFVLPLLLLWAFANMIRRAQEMRHAARTMTEAAIRLLQPEGISSDTVSTLGRSIRREVAAMGDGVERAIARAGELEYMVQSEVTNLERSYTDSEIKLRGLVSELSTERESIEGHAQKLRESIADTHAGLSDELNNASMKIQDSITIASREIGQTLEESRTDISASLLEAGENLAQNMSTAGNEIEARMAATGETVGAGIEAKTGELTERLKLAGNAMASLLDTRAVQIQQQGEQASKRFEEAVNTRSTEFAERISEAGNTLNSALDTRIATISSTLTSQGMTLVEALGMRTETLDKMLNERATFINSSIDDGIGKLVDGLGERSKLFDEALAKRTGEIHTSLNKQVGSLVEGLGSKTEALDKVLNNRTEQINASLVSNVSALVEGLGEKTEALDKVLAEKSKTLSESVTTNLSAIVKDVSANTAAIDKVLQDRSAQIHNVMGERVDDLVGGLDRKAIALDKVISDRTQAIGETIGERLSGFDTTLNSHVDNVVSQITVKTDELKETTDRIESVIEERTSSMNETLISRTKELVSTVSESEVQIAGAIAKGHKIVTEGLDQQLSDTAANLDAKAEHLAQLLSERASAINQSMGSNLVETQRTIEEHTGNISQMLSERTHEITSNLSQSADRLSEIVDEQAVPMITSMREAGEEVSNRLAETSQIVDNSVGMVIDKLGSSNEILRTLVDQAGENLGTIQASLAQQSSDLINAFDKASHDLELSGTLANEVRSGMEKTAAGLYDDMNAVSARLEEQGKILVDATQLIDASQSNFSVTLEARQEMLQELSNGLVARSAEIEGTMSKLAMAVGQMLEDANARSRELGGIVSAEVSTAINDATARFNNATESMKIAARDVSAELDQTREQMRRGVLELPEETRQSADSMRRVVTDQINALKQLSEIVTRSGKALDSTPASRESRERANAVSAGIARPSPRINAPAAFVQQALPVAPPERPVPQPQPSPAYQPMQTSAASAPFVPPAAPNLAPAPTIPRPDPVPPRSANRTPPTQRGSNAGGWVSDLLRRASNDEPVAPPAPPLRDGNANRSPNNVVESLNALSMDIARAIDHEASVELWDRYQRGERDVFTRRLYTIQGQQTFDEIQRKYQTQPEFANAVNRYVEDFERLLSDISRNDQDNVMTQTYLTSDTGKVYTMLAHASGKFGAV